MCKKFILVFEKFKIQGVNAVVRITVNHNKADGFERRLELYLMENFKHAFDMDRYAVSAFS